MTGQKQLAVSIFGAIKTYRNYYEKEMGSGIVGNFFPFSLYFFYLNCFFYESILSSDHLTNYKFITIQKDKMTMNNVVEGTDFNFEEEVLQSNTTVLVDFWAPWCGPCRTVAPMVEEIPQGIRGENKSSEIKH